MRWKLLLILYGVSLSIQDNTQDFIRKYERILQTYDLGGLLSGVIGGVGETVGGVVGGVGDVVGGVGDVVGGGVGDVVGGVGDVVGGVGDVVGDVVGGVGDVVGGVGDILGGIGDIVGGVVGGVVKTVEGLLDGLSGILGILNVCGRKEDVIYDYIVVGSGAAGSVVANKLSANPNIKVLVLESGGESNLMNLVPLFASLMQFTPQNWGYLMEKQDNFCLGLKDELMAWPRGRVLGGTSQINMMIHIRGNKLDYDRWAAAGNPGWAYKDMLPIFIEMENARLQKSDAGYHGYSGPLGVSDIPFRTKAMDIFIQAAVQSGYPNVDYNGESQMGVSYVQGTIINGRRCSAERGYIRSIRYRRPNLKVQLRSHVTKVLIHESNKTAYGVEYARNGILCRAYARKEVILSAGAYHSPQILMLSGIGPQAHLTELGIPVIKNSPVGEKLYDHLTYLGLIYTVNSDIVLNFFVAIASIGIWVLFGKGPLTSIGGVEGLLYFKTSAATYSENYPDMELIFIGGHLHTDYDLSFRKMFRISDEHYNHLWRPLYGKYAFGILPMLLHPKSVGYMKLRSKNPFHAPKFYGNYLTDPDGYDLRAFIAAIKESNRIIETSAAFKPFNAKLLNVPVLGCEKFAFRSDQYWECCLRTLSATLHHQIATCKMGPASDPEAVVDSRLRVYGINKLRVCDTSVIPQTLSAHTNVPAYGVGARGAQFILEDYVP